MALACVVLGLAVNRFGLGLAPPLRDAAGDALWATMIFAWLGILLARHSVRVRAVLAIVLCWSVELSQLYHTAILDAWRQTTLGRLTLGVGFDVRDLAAYAVGVLIGVTLEVAMHRRMQRA